MGGTTSKVEQQQKVDEQQNLSPEQSQKLMIEDIEKKKVVFDKAIGENINNLGELLNQFSKNDTEAIVDKIKKMDEFGGKFPSSLLNRVSTVHKTILDTIDTSLTPEDKKKQIESDSGIVSYINKFVDKDMDSKMKDYLNNPYIKNDEVVLKSMTDVTNNIKTIRSKYKYFEYKYVQMNMFLILFTKQMYTTINKFIVENAAFYEAREKYHLVLIHNVIKTFQNIFSDETRQLTDLDTGSFTDAMNVLTKSVMDTMQKQKQITQTQKDQSLSAILSVLMNQEAEFAKDILTAVDNYKTANPNTLEPYYKECKDPNNCKNSIPTGYVLTTGKTGILGFYRNVKDYPQFIPFDKFVSLGYPKESYTFVDNNDIKLKGYYLAGSRDFFKKAEFEALTPRPEGFIFLRNGPKGYGEGYYKALSESEYTSRSSDEKRKYKSFDVDGKRFYFMTEDVTRPEFIRQTSSSEPPPPGYILLDRPEEHGKGFYLLPNFLSEREYERLNPKPQGYEHRNGYQRDSPKGRGWYQKDTSRPVQYYGGDIRDGSLPTDADFQEGGFIRDGSFLPQKFYEL